ncbi:MAG: HAD family phosphatase [Acidobacteria bacterium]|nr:HAD family phosphatase [Acidobacteriota bacterium]
MNRVDAARADVGSAAKAVQLAFPYRLAAIDIDDTLVGPDKAIGDANRQAVQRLQQAGCRVVLASGRDHFSMDIYQRRLGLDDFVVSSQGALVVHPASGHQLWRLALEAPLAVELLQEGRAAGFEVLLCTDDGFVAATRSQWAPAGGRRLDASVHVLGGDLDALAHQGPLKVLWYGAPAAVASHSRRMVEALGERAEVVITTAHLLEFNARGATKAAGVAAVARHYGIDQATVLAFGDSHNDVSMLGWAGLGVAMPHAVPEARAAANVVAPEAPAESALAVAVESLLSR